MRRNLRRTEADWTRILLVLFGLICWAITLGTIIPLATGPDTPFNMAP